MRYSVKSTERNQMQFRLANRIVSLLQSIVWPTLYEILPVQQSS
jgi:hypothetical protein